MRTAVFREWFNSRSMARGGGRNMDTQKKRRHKKNTQKKDVLLATPQVPRWLGECDRHDLRGGGPQVCAGLDGGRGAWRGRGHVHMQHEQVGQAVPWSDLSQGTPRGVPPAGISTSLILPPGGHGVPQIEKKTSRPCGDGVVTCPLFFSARTAKNGHIWKVSLVNPKTRNNNIKYV